MPGTNIWEGGSIVMGLLTTLFGVENGVSLSQECARAVLLFFYGLVLLRLSGRRTFGHWSALDVIMSIIVGSALGRAMTASAPLLGTMAAAAVMAALHVIIARATTHSRLIAQLVEGSAVTLLSHGRVDEKICKRHMISKSDLAEHLRQHGLNGEKELENVKLVVLEPSGKVSVIKRGPGKPDLS